MAVGIFSSVMSLYEMLLNTLTIALKLFPWATTKTRLPDLIVGTIVLSQ
jgi:hypothetical protein